MNEENKKRIDFITLGILVAMSVLSIVAIYSALPLINSNYSALTILGKQIVWILLGYGITFFMFYLGTERFEKLIYISYYILLILLAGLVIQRYFHIGALSSIIREINGSFAWYYIKGIGTFQPSEFIKVVLIIVLANVIEAHHKKYPKNTFETDFYLILKILKYTLPPAFLIYYEPDSGVTLILLFSVVFMIIASGIKHQWIMIGIIAVAAIIGGVALLYLSNPDFVVNKLIGGAYKLRRIQAWLNPEDYKQGTGYQLYVSLLAIGSAGTNGYGLQNVPLTLPEAQTDFIFAVIASTFGLKGSLLTLSLCAALDIRLVYIGFRTKRNRNKYIIAGLVGLLAFQQIENMGMITGLLPITGITLPFISAGGSSMLSYMIILSFVLQMYNEYEKKEEATAVNAVKIVQSMIK